MSCILARYPAFLPTVLECWAPSAAAWSYQGKNDQQSWSQHTTAASQYQTLDIDLIVRGLNFLIFDADFIPGSVLGVVHFTMADRKDSGDMPVWKWVIRKVKLSSCLISIVNLVKYQGKGIGVGHSVMFLFGGKQVGIFYLTLQSLFFPNAYASKDGYCLWVRFCNCHWLSSWLPKSRMAQPLI